MIGMYVSVTLDHRIKRHLSTADGEVPLEDITVSDELIALTDRDFLHLCIFIKEALIDVFEFEDYEEGADCLKKDVAQDLSDQWKADPVYALLSELLIADRIRNRKNNRIIIDEIIHSLRNPISTQMLVMDVLESLCTKMPIADIPKYPVIQQFTTFAIHTLGETVTVQYVIRSYEQYYCFLLQQFIASKPNVTKCQYCGGYFIPRTKRRTLYCDRVIRDGKTCKQIAPYENRKKLAANNRVIAEFEHSLSRIRRRLERTGKDKKASPVDTTDVQFCQWLNNAMCAKNLYLAGELTEEEAMAIIYVPKKDELFQGN